MAQTPQPHLLSGWINAFTSFDEAHGFAVNLFAVVALALIGAAFVSGRQRLARPAVIAFTVLCLADWVLVEDFGFFGGLGTDPNSMIPFALLAISGYLALAPVPASATAAQAASPGRPAASQPVPGAPEPSPPARRDPSGLAGPTPARGSASVGRSGEHPHRRLHRRARADHLGRGSDGRRSG